MNGKLLDRVRQKQRAHAPDLNAELLPIKLRVWKKQDTR